MTHQEPIRMTLVTGDQAPPTICLTMMVKDEEAVLPRAIRSALPWIDSYCIQVDSKTTDATRDVIDELLGDLPGERYDADFTNFGENRTDMVRRATGHGDWLLVLDADFTVVREGDTLSPDGLPDIHALLDANVDALTMKVQDRNEDYWMPFLVNATGGREWRYEGYAHEHIEVDGGSGMLMQIPFYGMLNHCDGASWADNQAKFDKAVELLTAEHEAKPDDPRTVFYLAQSYEASGQAVMAADWYDKRADMGGFPEEAFVARYRCGRILMDQGNWPEATLVFLAAWQMRPTRAEPLCMLARLFRNRGDYDLAYLFADRGASLPQPNDTLFVPRWVYEWGCLFERAVAGFYAGDRQQSRRDVLAIIADERVPMDQRALARMNLAFY